MHDFNDLEGLRIAIEMEKRGEALYRKAARVSKLPEVKAMLEALARDEVAHAAEFEALQKEACARRDACVSYGEEASAYLSAVAADIVFPGGLMALREEGFDDIRAVHHASHLDGFAGRHGAGEAMHAVRHEDGRAAPVFGKHLADGHALVDGHNGFLLAA